MKRKYGLTDDYREIQSIHNHMCMCYSKMIILTFKTYCLSKKKKTMLNANRQINQLTVFRNLTVAGVIFQCNMGGHAGDIEYGPSFTSLFHTLGYKLKEGEESWFELCWSGHAQTYLRQKQNCLVVNAHDPKDEHTCLHNP